MHLVTCNVSIGGDDRTIVHRGPDNPVSWPEAQLLMYIHGEHSVRDVQVLGEDDVRPADEKARLMSIYGAAAVDIVFPGRVPAMEMDVPGHNTKKSTAKGGKKLLADEPELPLDADKD